MTKSGNLWAIGYDNMEQADQVREEIISLGWHKHYLQLDGREKKSLFAKISSCKYLISLRRNLQI